MLAAMLPGDFARSRAAIGQSRESEEQVREPIEIDDGERRKIDVTLQPDDMPFGAATHRAGDVQRRRLGRAARNNEGVQRLELQLRCVDGMLERLYRAGVYLSLEEVKGQAPILRTKEPQA